MLPQDVLLVHYKKDCESGAIGAAVGEVVAELMPTPDPNLPNLEFQHIQNKK